MENLVMIWVKFWIAYRNDNAALWLYLVNLSLLKKMTSFETVPVVVITMWALNKNTQNTFIINGFVFVNSLTTMLFALLLLMLLGLPFLAYKPVVQQPFIHKPSISTCIKFLLIENRTVYHLWCVYINKTIVQWENQLELRELLLFFFSSMSGTQHNESV